MTVTYTALVEFTRDDGTTGSALVGAETATAAAVAADRDATYYRSMGWTVRVTLLEQCGTCGGRGTTPPKRRKLGPPVSCRTCRGRNPEKVVKSW